MPKLKDYNNIYLKVGRITKYGFIYHEKVINMVTYMLYEIARSGTQMLSWPHSFRIDAASEVALKFCLGSIMGLSMLPFLFRLIGPYTL